MLIWIIIVITIIFLSLNIKISIQNYKNNNFVKIKLFIFTLDLDYIKVINSLKKIGIKNSVDFKEQFKRYLMVNPLIKGIVSEIVVETAEINKFFDNYDQTYEIITTYLLSSYFNGFLNFNFKKLKNYKCKPIYSEDRNDLDFKFIFKIRIINIILSFIKNVKVLFKYIKRRVAHGS